MLELKKQNIESAEPKLPSPVRVSRTRLGTAASKIYRTQDQSSLGLSAELLTFRERRGANPNLLNVMNVSPTFGFRLHPRLLFNSQFLFENGGAESSNSVVIRKGQAVVLMAYVDWLSYATHDFGIRVGHQLVPVGWTNTLNEPGTFLGVLRPPLERDLIPSQWHENGLTIWVDRPRAEIQLGVFNSLNAEGFRKDTFLAGGRSQGQNAPAENLMGVFRADAKFEHLLVGVSTAFGNSAHKTAGITTGTFMLSEFHMKFSKPRFQALWMLAEAELQQAGSISIMNSTDMGERARGHSLELAVDLLGRSQALWFFVRRSEFDLHDRLPEGRTRDDSLHKTIGSIGFNYLPLKDFVLKTDYSFIRNALSEEDDEVAFSAGLSF